VKHLDAIRKESKRISKKLGLEADQVAGFGDGTYRLEFHEPKADGRLIGFKPGDES
jgi:hypothetical protein